ncbi:MAG: cation:proton antiporter subunit C [Spirochaetales bacterium]|nr:cation:proton antiporter subunit C [Spirochaetales bacterium]
MIERLLLLLLFLTGFWGILEKKNIIKKIFGLTLINSAAVLLFVIGGSETGKHTPIMEKGIVEIVDPVPQALMLTAIVIGVCVTALALALAYRLYKASGSFNIDTIRKAVHDMPEEAEIKAEETYREAAEEISEEAEQENPVKKPQKEANNES